MGSLAFFRLKLRIENDKNMLSDNQLMSGVSGGRDLALGHLLALFTVVVWGVTFVSTKVLLEVLTPVEILCVRFVLGYLFLWVLWPRRLTRRLVAREELYFFFAGLTGICLYYLAENVALVFTPPRTWA